MVNGMFGNMEIRINGNTVFKKRCEIIKGKLKS